MNSKSKPSRGISIKDVETPTDQQIDSNDATADLKHKLHLNIAAVNNK